MQLNLTGHHMEITPALRSYIENKFERLERHFEQMTNIHVILSIEKERQKAEATIHVNRGNIYADSQHEDMYAAIDALIDKLDRQVKKHKEKLTDPIIMEELARQVNEIAEKDPEAIIQAIVPLLIEINQQHRFHKVLVVHVPEAVQIERLVKRDGIGKEEAADRLKAQLPIDAKLAYADFVIYNQGSLEETKKQVKTLWEELKRIQRAYAGRRTP